MHSNNGTKSTPSLSGDILGDWREEVVWPTTDNTRAAHLHHARRRPTSGSVTLMHDPQYREAVAWQNTAYNQPPHPSFFIGSGMCDPAGAADLRPVGPCLPGLCGLGTVIRGR